MIDHIDSISDRLMEYALKEAAEHTAKGNEKINIKVKAGELLGYTDGTSMAHTFDFLMQTSVKKAEYINPDRWNWDQALYSVCPYDYFADDLRQKYYQKLNGQDCGSPSHDVAGTASGGWFQGEDSNDFEGNYLAVAHIRNEVMIVLKTDDLEKRERAEFVVRVWNPEIYPEEIKIGQEYCYQDLDNSNWAYLKVLPEEKLEFVKGQGSCPASFQESRSEIWER